MKSEEAFTAFYNNELKSSIEELQEEAREIYGEQSLSSKERFDLFKVAGVFILISSPVLIWIWYSTGSFPFFWTAVIAIAGYSISKKFGNYFRKGAKFSKKFKQKLIKKIVHFFDDDFSYKPREGFSKEDINDSLILSREAGGLTAEDFVSGKVGDTDIAFCEIVASTSDVKQLGGSNLNEEQREKMEDMKHMVEKFANTSDNFFRGIYFRADFHKRFQAKTLVRPTAYQWNDYKKEDRRGKTKTKVGSKYHPDDRIDDLEQVHLEDVELEKAYNVYSNDQQQARYVLSTTMMERIKEFSGRTGKMIFLCFWDSKMHLAIPYDRDLLEPDISQDYLMNEQDLDNVLDREKIFTFYKDLNFLLGIVEDFNLNKRIWAK